LNRDRIAEEGGINLYTAVRNSPLDFLDLLGEGSWKVLTALLNLDPDHMGDPNGFEVQYTPDPGECPCGTLVLYQTISSTGLRGEFAHVDATPKEAERNRKTKGGTLPPPMWPQGSTPYSYEDAPWSGAVGIFGVWTFRITAVAVCRSNGKDTVLGTYYFEFDNGTRKIITRDPNRTKHYKRALERWEKERGSEVPQI
jgi:hypothetical protein